MAGVHESFPLPDTSWAPAAPFWEAAARHQLAIPRCDTCEQLCWYPRERCPHCAGEAFSWTATSGTGALFAWTVVRHAFLPAFRSMVPFVTGLVALDDDPRVRLATRIVDVDPATLVPDLPVEVVFAPMRFDGVDGEVTAPFFRPRSS